MLTSPSRSNGGTYALILALDEETTIAVGKLPTFTFPIGYYLYVGSALGRLAPRIRRHLQGSGKLHWHIAVWENDRNNRQSKIHWHFFTNDARIKLKHLYPKL